MNGPYGLPGTSPEQRYERREALGWLPRGYIAGLILSNDGTDATNDIAISAGMCRSTVNIVEDGASTLHRHQRDIEIPVSIIKQLDVSWAPANYDPDGYSGGGRSGMLNPLSSIADTAYHLYAVGGGDCQDDVIAISSAAQADVLAAIQVAGGFTAYRRIGSIFRASSAIRLFTQVNDDFILTTPVLDQNGALGGTGDATITLTVPGEIRVIAHINVSLSNSGDALYLAPIGVASQAPSATAAPLATSRNSAGHSGSGPHRILTNPSRQIYARISANNAIYVTTLGWTDARDRNA